MTSKTLDELVDTLARAWRDNRPADSAPWDDTVPDAARAYLAQGRLADAMDWFGGRPVQHWKSGGASRDAVLTHAPLPPARVRASPADFSDGRFFTTAIESEVALRLAESITPEWANSLSGDEAETDALIDAMTVSIEVVDTRWQTDRTVPALLRLVDLQSHGALVLGEWVPYARRDWQAQRCETTVGMQPASMHTGTHPLGDPAWLLPAWLRHATRHGDVVAAGTVVTTGSWVGLVPVARGQRVVADFPGIGHAEMRL